MAGYNGLTKAAVVLSALEDKEKMEIFKHLEDSEIRKVLNAISELKTMSVNDVRDILKDFYRLVAEETDFLFSADDDTKSLILQALGEERARAVLGQLNLGSSNKTTLESIDIIDPRSLANFLINEHPQTISLILTQLNAHHAASVLAELSQELQAEVSLRVATMEKISPEILKEIEQTLEGHFEQSGSAQMSVSGGAKAIAEILNLIDSTAEKNILQSLEAEDPDLAGEVKNMMFVFDDVTLLDDRSIQRLLKEIETKDLSLALKATSDEVKRKIFANVSERVGSMIQEEMEFMGPTRLSDVEAAQSRIVEAVRRLEEEGQIIISGRGGKEDIIV